MRQKCDRKYPRKKDKRKGEWEGGEREEGGREGMREGRGRKENTQQVTMIFLKKGQNVLINI